MLCRADKSPFWRRWQHNRAPLDEVEYHQARGLPVGVIPWSLRASGLDVDWGNPSDFATAYPPMARLPSRRPGGQHLWYRDTQPRRNLQQLAFPGWSGDLRSRTGYLINWAGEAGWEALLDGVIHERGVLFPADALGTASTSILEQTQGVPAPASIPWERTAAGLPNLRVIMPGQRNLALFDHVRFWAYKASLGRDLDEWHKRVEYHANNLNRFFSVSLETQEVGEIAYSVATWTWARPALNHAPEVQAARGRRSGQSRRDTKAGRNLTIRDLKDDGWTVEDIAAIIGIHQRTVYRAMQSQQPTLIRSVSTDTNLSGGGIHQGQAHQRLSLGGALGATVRGWS